MKAILLATAERDNLSPLMANFPSPMLPIANRPLIAYPVELMIRHQFREIVVSVMRHADRIDAYCATGRRWNVDFTYLFQREALGSAGSIKRAQRLLTETFLVMPGDALVDVNLSSLYAFHRAHGGMATALIAPNRDEQTGAAVVLLNEDSQICSIQNHAQNYAQSNAQSSTRHRFTGVFIFEPEIFQHIPAQTNYDCIDDLLPHLMAQGIAVHGTVHTGYWNPLDSVASYQAAQEDYLGSLNAGSGIEAELPRLNHAYVEAGDYGDGIWRGPNVTIHPTARIHGPVLLGAACQIGRDVTIGPNAIIGSNCIIDDGATITAATILPDTYIGKLLNVQKKIVNGPALIDIASGTCVEVTDRLLLGRAGPQEANSLLRNMLERLIALGMLLLVLPLLMVLVLLAWMAGAGSAFVWVPRIGRRPLHVREDGAAVPMRIHLLRLRTRAEDDRATHIGQWLEKWGFYRLPELVNVLFGEIALVGVKPLSDDELDLIDEEWQRRRFDCPAGFTGRWYTEIRHSSDADELFVVDAYQTAVQSTRDSLLQVVKTPVVWWQRRNVTLPPTRRNHPQPYLRARLPHYFDDNPLNQ